MCVFSLRKLLYDQYVSRIIIPQAVCILNKSLVFNKGVLGENVEKCGTIEEYRKREERRMVIQGLQKLTLLDYPGKTACTVFTGGCNFRCPFCHNSDLVLNVDRMQMISEDEVLSFLKKRRGILDGVCVTGGEPLVQKDVESFLKKVKDMGFLVKLDTNGSFPDRLKKIVENHLVDYVAMDIKNSKEKYAKTIGIKGYDCSEIEKSVDFLMEGRVEYEFRTTVVREFHEAEDLRKISEWIKGAEHYYLQQFVDSGNLIEEGLHGYTKEEMEELLKVVKEQAENADVRGV